MKLGIQISVPEKTENMHEFVYRLKTIKKLGYDGVELSVRDPKNIEVKKIVTLIERLRLEVPAIATGRAFIQDGLSLMSPCETRQLRSLARFKDQIEFASLFGAKVIVGLIRGKVRGDLGQILKTYEEFALDKGVELVLEPINRYEMNFIHTAKEATDFIKEANLRNTGVLIDTFHMNIEETRIAEVITDMGETGLLKYVHIADNNRLAPGEGHLDFVEILCSIADAGYEGYLSAEIIFKPDFKTAARNAVEELRRILERKKIGG